MSILNLFHLLPLFNDLKYVDHVRDPLILPQIRYSLFELFRKWSGNLNLMTVFASTR